MGRSCVVSGCASRAERGTKRFFRIPAVISRQGDNILKLSVERRRLWLEAINRRDFTPTQYHCYVCSDHFVGGQPADIMRRDNPDWIPTMKLGTGPEYPSACPRRRVNQSLYDNFKTQLLGVSAEPELHDPLDTSLDSSYLYPTVRVKTKLIDEEPGDVDSRVERTSESKEHADACVATIKKEPESVSETDDWVGSSGDFIQDFDCTSTCSRESKDLRYRDRENELLERISQVKAALLESRRMNEVLAEKLNWTQKELQAKEKLIEKLESLLNVKSENRSATETDCN